MLNDMQWNGNLFEVWSVCFICGHDYQIMFYTHQKTFFRSLFKLLKQTKNMILYRSLIEWYHYEQEISVKYGIILSSAQHIIFP